MSFHDDDAWDDVDTSRWIRNDDLERLDRNLATNASYGKRGSTQQARSEAHRLQEIRETYREDDAVPSARRVAEFSDESVSRTAYARFADTWDDVLRLAGVPTVVDVVAEWIVERQTGAERSAKSFRARDIADGVGLSSLTVAGALARLRDGVATEPATDFDGRVVAVSERGSTLWGVER
jgi:hypothetical protein